ncbi:MAG: VIT1/CCC1 transporter family protein [Candidatus Omnitrophica bacterium]|nr:VIT1/CCC1 transporter family protein [Candidatus Omnitrophota bacterium]
MTLDLAQEKREIAMTGKVRDFIFGIQDGLISTLGLLCGVQSATDNSKTVIIAGVAAMLTGALSMAASAFLSTQAQKEIIEKELKEEEEYAGQKPDLAHRELTDALHQEGLGRESASRVVKLFSKHKFVFIREFQEKVFGMSPVEMSRPLLSAVVIYVSFVLGAAVPIAPYFFFNADMGLRFSIFFSASLLFAVGMLKNYLAKKSMLAGGMEFLIVAAGSAALGWVIGRLIIPGMYLITG